MTSHNHLTFLTSLAVAVSLTATSLRASEDPTSLTKEAQLVLDDSGRLLIRCPGESSIPMTVGGVPLSEIKETATVVIGDGIETVRAICATEKETLSQLFEQAEKARRHSRFDRLSVALSCIDLVAPDHPNRKPYGARGIPTEIANSRPPDAKWSTVFNGKSLAGLKTRRGHWSVEKKLLVAEPTEDLAMISISRRPRGSDWEISAEINRTGETAGLFIRRRRGAGIGFLVTPREASLVDLDSSTKLMTDKGARSGTIQLKVMGNTLVGLLNGKKVVESDLGGEPVVDGGVLAGKHARFRTIQIRSSPSVRWIDKSLEALRRGRGDLAFPLARGVAEEGFTREGDLLVGSSLLLLGLIEEGQRNIDRAEAACRKIEALATITRRCLAQAATVARLVANRESEALTPLNNLVSTYRRAIDTEIDAGRGELADVLARRLMALRPRDRSTRLLRLHTFTRARGKGGVIPLFNGTNLKDWTLRGGQFEVRQGIINVPSSIVARDAIRRGIPEASRFLLETEYRASSVYEIGFALSAGEQTYRVALRNVFHEKAIIIRKEDGTERMRREFTRPIPSGDGQWHRLAVFIDRNRIVVFIDHEKFLVKIFAVPLTGNPGLFVGANSAAEFRNPTLRLFDTDKEYEEFLGRHDLLDHIVIEAEEALETGRCKGASGEEFMPHAFNGRLLGAGFGRSTDHFALYSFETGAWTNGWLHLRYKSHRNDRKMRIGLDDREPLLLIDLPADPNADFSLATLELGPLSRGDHSLRLSPRTKGAPIALDRITVSSKDSAEDDVGGEVAAEGYSQFRLKLSPGVKLPAETNEIFAMVEDLRDYMSAFLGIVLSRPLTVNVISRDCWGDPHIGGYATGDHLYIPFETLQRDLGTVAHELSHCFDFGQGFIPPWFGEGKSLPVFVDFMKERGEKYRWNALRGINSRALVGRSSKKRLIQPDGTTLLQYWGTDRFTYGEHPLRSAGYDASAYLCADLQKRYGSSYLKSFHALVQHDLEQKTYLMPKRTGNVQAREIANSILVDYLSRAVQDDLRPYFKEWGFTRVEYCEKGVPMLATPEAEGLYLTESGESVVQEEKQPEATNTATTRTIANGRVVYAFPVPRDCQHMELLIRVTGEGTITVEDREATPITSASSPVLEVVVDDPEELADARIRVVCEGRGIGLKIAGVRATPR